MAGSVNKVILIGNLGADPEVRYTQNQVAVATLSLATTEFRQTADGQKQELTEWHRVVAWNKVAENCGKYLSKGRTIFVEGKLQTRSWDDKATGQKRYSTEIVAQNIQFLGGPPAGASKPNQPFGEASQNPYNQGPSVPDFDAQFNAPSSSGHSQSHSNMDDIPF